MADISSTIPYLLAKPSGDPIETVIGTQGEKQFTGLMRFYHSTGENLVALFLEGTQKKLYRSSGKNMEVISRNSWLKTMARTDTSISFLNTSLEVLRVMQVGQMGINGFDTINTKMAILFSSWENYDT